MSQQEKYWKERCMQAEMVLNDVLEEKGLPTLAIGQEVWMLYWNCLAERWEVSPDPCKIVSSDGRNAVVAKHLPRMPETNTLLNFADLHLVAYCDIDFTYEKAHERADQMNREKVQPNHQEGGYL